MENHEAKDEFLFYSRLSLTELTGLRAVNLEQLLALVKEVPDSCIFHHTHRFLRQHLHLSPEPPNDFAYWVFHALGEARLAEALASIDIVRLDSLRAIREKIASTMEDYMARSVSARQRFASENETFHFLKSVSFIFPTGRTARTLPEFAGQIRQISMDSIYFHMFEARLRLEKGDNDFSLWLAESAGEPEIAEAVSRLDPYTCTAEGLRSRILDIVERRRAA